MGDFNLGGELLQKNGTIFFCGKIYTPLNKREAFKKKTRGGGGQRVGGPSP